jgi:hypothetical protein
VLRYIGRLLDGGRLTVEDVDDDACLRLNALPTRFQLLVLRRYRDALRPEMDALRSESREERWRLFGRMLRFTEAQRNREALMLDNGVLRDLRDYSGAQRRAGVRCQDLEDVTCFAAFIHPAAAIELQRQHERGVHMSLHLDAPAFYEMARRGTAAVSALRLVGTHWSRTRNPSAALVSALRRARA